MCVCVGQVDSEEIDRLSGRVRVNRDKFAKYSGDKLHGIMRTGPSVAEVTANLAKRASVSETPPPTRPSNDPHQLPKQSGFVPRSRKSAILDDDNEAMPEIPNILRQKTAAVQRSNSTPSNEVLTQ